MWLCAILIPFSAFLQVSDAALDPVLRDAIEEMVRALQLRRVSVAEVRKDWSPILARVGCHGMYSKQYNLKQLQVFSIFLDRVCLYKNVQTASSTIVLQIYLYLVL